MLLPLAEARKGSRAAAEPEVFRRLLARVEQLQAGVYDPHRGHSWADAACRAALTEHHGHWGPFVAYSQTRVAVPAPPQVNTTSLMGIYGTHCHTQLGEPASKLLARPS